MINEYELLRAKLDASLKTFNQNGIALANAEREYRVALAKEMLILREKGLPVSIITDVARGTDNVAELRLKRDCVKSVYQANQEAINVNKLEINVIKAIYETEYRNG